MRKLLGGIIGTATVAALLIFGAGRTTEPPPLSGGIHLGSHFVVDAGEWAKHDIGIVSATYSLHDPGRSVVLDILDINKDWRGIMWHPMRAIHGYCEDRSEGWMADYWQMMCVSNDYRMRMTDGQVFYGWPGSPDINLTIPGAIEATVDHLKKGYTGTDYEKSGRMGILWDFVDTKLHNWGSDGGVESDNEAERLGWTWDADSRASDAALSAYTDKRGKHE